MESAVYVRDGVQLFPLGYRKDDAKYIPKPLAASEMVQQSCLPIETANYGFDEFAKEYGKVHDE
jgi:hypothetical protein